jgi:hypothetical protein
VIAHDTYLLLREVGEGEDRGDPILAVDTPVRRTAIRDRLIRVAPAQPDPSRWVLTTAGRGALSEADR